jgi:hypothetical protein
VAGARPNHQPIGDLEPPQAGDGTREEPGTLTQDDLSAEAHVIKKHFTPKSKVRVKGRQA